MALPNTLGISELLDEVLPADGVGTGREKLRMRLHRGIRRLLITAKPDALAELRKAVQESLKEVRESAFAEADGGEGATTVKAEVKYIMDAVNVMLAKTKKS